MKATTKPSWEIPAFLGITMLLAIYIIASPGVGNDWILDPLTGVVAVVAIIAACIHLAQAALDPRASRLWQLAVTVLVLVCLAQFSETISEQLGRFIGLDGYDDYLILAVAPIVLAIIARLNVPMAHARRTIYLAFLIQFASTIADSYSLENNLANAPAVWEMIADFANFVSVSLYLASMFLMAFGPQTAIAGLRTGLRTSSPSIDDTSSPYPVGVRDGLFPPPFILGWHLPPSDTPAGRIHRICNQALWPSGHVLLGARNVAMIALWPVVASVRAMRQIKRRGENFVTLTGKSKTQQFLEQVKLAVQFRIPPAYYYIYELYDPRRQSLSAHYLMRYQTKEIAYRLLYPIGSSQRAPAPLRDKARFAQHCRMHDLRHAETLFEAVDGYLGDADLPDCDLFLKPARGKGGSGAERWNLVREGLYRDTRGWELTARQLRDHIEELSAYVEPYVVQRALRNHPSIGDLTPGSLCTVRMLTFRRGDGGCEVTDAAFRMPIATHSAADNFHAGGIAALVDVRTGRLAAATGLETRGGTVWHRHHPFTNALIEGRQLPMWREAVELVADAHSAFKDYALIGWDVALAEGGPVLIEGNRGPDVDILQRTGRGPIGNKRFGELLAYNLENRARSR